MTKHSKPRHLKKAQFSLSLPEWHRHLLGAIDPKSSSRAAAKLIHYAIHHGALGALAPSLPPITDLADLAAYLTGRPLVAAPAPAPQPDTSAELAALFADWEDDAPDQAPAQPLAQVMPTTLKADAWTKPADQINENDQRAIMQRIEAELRAGRGI